MRWVRFVNISSTIVLTLHYFCIDWKWTKPELDRPSTLFDYGPSSHLRKFMFERLMQPLCLLQWNDIKKNLSSTLVLVSFFSTVFSAPLVWSLWAKENLIRRCLASQFIKVSTFLRPVSFRQHKINLLFGILQLNKAFIALFCTTGFRKNILPKLYIILRI